MKIYTSEIEQFGKELKILHHKVKFDTVGCAEVDDKVGKQLIDYSPWYSETKHSLKKVEVKKTIEDQFNAAENEQLKVQIDKMKKSDESRVSKIKALEQENQDIRTDMSKVVEERDKLKNDIDAKQQIWDKEKAALEHKFELALLEIDELKDMCGKLGIPEEKYIKKRNKKQLIEMIVNEAQ